VKTGKELEASLEEQSKNFNRAANQEQPKDLYKDKLFYEVIKTGPEEFKLIGPLTNIYYKRDLNGFLQVIDGIPRAEFTLDEIYVTKTAIVGRLSKLYEGVLNENK
jgi:hypothetical protein